MTIEDLKRTNLYIEYCKELNRYYNSKWSPATEHESVTTAESYLSDIQFTWHDLTKDGLLVGFLITARNLIYIHGKGLYICECYIRPSYRGQGLFRKEIIPMLEDNKHPVYLEILEKNQKAKRMWDHIFKQTGYKMQHKYLRRAYHAGILEYCYEKEK